MVEELCAICLNDRLIDNDDDILICGHSFHLRCIKQWFETSRISTCPICRYNTYIETQNDEPDVQKIDILTFLTFLHFCVFYESIDKIF